MYIYIFIQKLFPNNYFTINFPSCHFSVPHCYCIEKTENVLRIVTAIDAASKLVRLQHQHSSGVATEPKNFLNTHIHSLKLQLQALIHCIILYYASKTCVYHTEYRFRSVNCDSNVR